MKKLLTLLTIFCVTSAGFAQGQAVVTEEPDSLIRTLIEELEMIDGDSAEVLRDSLAENSAGAMTKAGSNRTVLMTDSLKVAGDSLAARQDSLDEDSAFMSLVDSLMNDTIAMQRDSLTNDSLGQRRDSLQVDLMDNKHMDKLMVKFDKLMKKSDSLMVVRDSIVADSIRKVEEYRRTHTPQLNEARKLVSDYRTFRKNWIENWDDIFIYSSDVVSNADYYKLSMPATYYNASIEEAMSIDGWTPKIPFVKEEQPLVPYPCEDVRTSEKVNRYVNREMLGFYLSYPELVKQNESVLEKLTPLTKDMIVREAKPENITEMVTPTFEMGQMTENDLLVLRPNFWRLGGGGYLNFSQNFISENWYKGGESSVSLLSGLEFQANFDNRQMIQFENKVEWKLGFITTPSDTVHSYKANNDLFRISSKLGVKAFKNWYYTLSLEFRTQFFSNYATNSNKLVSALLSPAELNVGIGMDYKFVKKGKCNLSVLLKPLNYTMYSVLSDEVDPTKFNIEKGHKVHHTIGSRMDLNLKWMIAKSLVWESKFVYSTNYEKVLADWENKFSYSFNRFLSTNLFINARYDDGVPKVKDNGYFQVQEILGFGVSYVW